MGEHQSVYSQYQGQICRCTKKSACKMWYYVRSWRWLNVWFDFSKTDARTWIRACEWIHACWWVTLTTLDWFYSDDAWIADQLDVVVIHCQNEWDVLSGWLRTHVGISRLTYFLFAIESEFLIAMTRSANAKYLPPSSCCSRMHILTHAYSYVHAYTCIAFALSAFPHILYAVRIQILPVSNRIAWKTKQLHFGPRSALQ